ncbi:ATP-grasp domain-containing protein, partial [Candidatus Electrothrix marina]
MKNVLLVDTNFSSAPIYDYIKRSGYRVFVCGGNSSDFLARSVEDYIKIDYSDLNKMQELIRSRHIDYIVPGCNDLSYQVCTQLNTERRFSGLDDYETSESINNKEKFRQLAGQLALPAPGIIPSEKLGYVWPIIVKPVDAYSGRGVTVVHEAEKGTLPFAMQQAEKYSRTGSCIVEEYIEGQLYSHSAFFSAGEILMDFIVEEHGTANPFTVDTSWVSYEFPTEMLLCIRNAIQMLAKKLNLVDGLIHTQFIRNEGKFWLIEVTRRCPGDLYSKLIELSTGFHYVESYVRPFLNQAIPSESNVSLKQSYILRHTISQPIQDLFGSIQFNLPLQIEKMVSLTLSGDLVKSSPLGRIALLFAKANSKKEMCNLIDFAPKREL